MKRPHLDRTLVLSSSAFCALMASVLSGASLQNSLPRVPSSLLVQVQSAEDVTSFSALAQGYGYRTLLQDIDDAGIWVLRLTSSVAGSGGGYFPSVPQLPECPGFRPRIPHLIVDRASDIAASIAPRVLRWWIGAR